MGLESVRMHNSIFLLIAIGLVAIVNPSLAEDKELDIDGPSKQEIREALLKADEILAIRRAKRSARGNSAFGQVHQYHRSGGPGSARIHSQQERYEEATKHLRSRYSNRQIRSVAQDHHCPNTKQFNCDANYPYRTADGSCNNLKNPAWGSSERCFARLMSAFYDDGVSRYRRAASGQDLPSPRTVSLKIHGLLNRPTNDSISHMTMQWGQFTDHDMTIAPLVLDITCCPENKDEPNCGAILLGEDDPFFSGCNVTCLDNTRSVTCLTCFSDPREQMQVLTSYLDASMVYGSTKKQADKLRVLNEGNRKGELKSIEVEGVGELLPQGPDGSTPFTCSDLDEDKKCFFAGDGRVNEHPGLTSMHTVFLRLHNIIVRRLRSSNPSWNDEKLYQTGRRIVGAIVQVIVYKEWLPIIVGQKAMDSFGLKAGEDTTYDENVDGTVMNEFSTAAFRFGHTLINSFEEVHEPEPAVIDSFEIRNTFFFPFGLYDGQMIKVALGLLTGPIQTRDRYIELDVTNHLYKKKGECSGLDLASLNVFRGRDHGLPPYVEVVRFAHNIHINSFSDLETSGLFPAGHARIFERVYDSPRDIDLFSGGISELSGDGLLGPTFTYIIATQFERLKFGDRFYFEHKDQPTSFTKDQRDELRKMTLSQILCQTLDLGSVQRTAFLLRNDTSNPVVRCSDYGAIRVDLWDNSI